MALFKICRGLEGNLPSDMTNGYAYFCTNTGNFYIDHMNEENTLVRSKISAKYADQLRYTIDGETIEINPINILTDSNYENRIGLASPEHTGLMTMSDKEKLDGISTGAQVNVQSDWNENDITSDAYINNRPFYTTSPQEVQVCSGTYDFIDVSEMGVPLYRAKIDEDFSQLENEVGQEVRIVYDGTTYNLTTKYIDALDMYYVGNGSLVNSLGATEENTGEPFIYTLGAYFFTSDTDAQHAIQIFVSQTEVITIPHKYLGMNVWAGEQENSIVMHTEDNVASGFRSLATGWETTASGDRSHAEGNGTTASAENAHAEGSGTTASNYNAHAEGVDTVASGHTSHAEGVRTEASGQASHTEGNDTKASAWNAHAEGQGTEAASKSQHVFGEYNIVDESAGAAERGKYIQIAGNGGSSNAKSNAYTLDWNGVAWFKDSVKVGGISQDDETSKTLATTDTATVDADGLMSSTDKAKLDGIEEGATAVGHSTTGKTMVDDTEIEYTGQIGDEIFNYSGNIAAGRYAHAEGYKTIADGQYAHAEGQNTVAIGGGSHAEGSKTIANGTYSHAEGYQTEAYGLGSHVEGEHTYAIGDYQHVQGRYNIRDSIDVSDFGKYAHIVGNGEDILHLSNAHTIDWDGNGWFAGDVKVGGTGQDDEAAKTLATTDVATTETSGLMSAADKSKLDGIAEGANKTTVDTVMSDTSTNPVQNKIVNEALSKKLDSESPAGTGSLSLNRKAGTDIGLNSVAIGYNNTASGKYSEAHGYNTTSTNEGSHAEGHGTTASGYASHAEGLSTNALGGYSHAEGYHTTADAMTAHAEGTGTTAVGTNQHVQGKYNATSGTLAHIVGNGDDDDHRSNAHTLDWNGNAWFRGDIKIGGTGYNDTAAKTIATTEYVDTKTDGVTPVVKGGTGADNAADARTNLSITPKNIGAEQTVATYITTTNNPDFDLDTATDSLYLIPSTFSKNCPVGTSFIYIRQIFYSTISSTANRTQIAYPYASSGGTIPQNCMAIRACNGGVWSEWKQLVTTDYAVNKAGDKMTGNLHIEKDTPIVYASDTTSGREARLQYNAELTYIHNLLDNTHYAAIMLGKETSSMKNLLRVQQKNGDTANTYSVIHEGNKNLITPADIGALPVAIPLAPNAKTITTSGRYYMMGATDCPAGGYGWLEVFIHPESTQWRHLRYTSATEDSKWECLTKDDGATWTDWVQILNTGNKNLITPTDIGAATTSAVEAANTAATNAQTTANAAMPKSGGTFTGTVKAQANTAYTTYQVRNIALSTTAAVPTGNGSILGVYA